MAVAPNRRSIMTLYSKGHCPYSHRVRMVLAEKGVTVDILDLEKNAKLREELLELNPYGTVPTLLDRELVVYESLIIMEYLDERFPHPPLMPVYPVARARSRLMMHRINKDWYGLMAKIIFGMNEETNESKDSKESKEAGAKGIGVERSAEGGVEEEVKKARKELQDSIVSISPVLNEMPYFLSEEFSLVDCCIAPLLWRLPMLGITLPPTAKSVLNYSQKLFKRDSFLNSLSEAERAMPREESK